MLTIKDLAVLMIAHGNAVNANYQCKSGSEHRRAILNWALDNLDNPDSLVISGDQDAEISMLSKQIREYEIALADLKASKDKLIRELKAKAESLDTDNTAKHSRIIKLRCDLDRAEKRIDELIDQIDYIRKNPPTSGGLEEPA